eukprot:2326723-Lingulodinium_polyedra.AAC.1
MTAATPTTIVPAILRAFATSVTSGRTPSGQNCGARFWERRSARTLWQHEQLRARPPATQRRWRGSVCARV